MKSLELNTEQLLALISTLGPEAAQEGKKVIEQIRQEQKDSVEKIGDILESVERVLGQRAHTASKSVTLMVEAVFSTLTKLTMMRLPKPLVENIADEFMTVIKEVIDSTSMLLITTPADEGPEDTSPEGKAEIEESVAKALEFMKMQRSLVSAVSKHSRRSAMLQMDLGEIIKRAIEKGGEE
jgi:urease gamma subunit